MLLLRGGGTRRPDPRRNRAPRLHLARPGSIRPKGRSEVRKPDGRRHRRGGRRFATSRRRELEEHTDEVVAAYLAGIRSDDLNRATGPRCRPRTPAKSSRSAGPKSGAAKSGPGSPGRTPWW